MKTLYVSDLDGTLLRSDEITSKYTNRVINSLTDKGMIFSYATARSFITAQKVTKGLTAKIPLIVYNGAFVIDNISEKILIENFFDNDVDNLLEDLFHNEVYPIVYAFIHDAEKFSFVPELCTQGMNFFINSRKGDIRTNAVETVNDLRSGKIFYITCIDEPKKLEPLYKKYQNDFHCVYQKDIYSKAQWLEFMPKETSKANAIKQLQALMMCDRLVVFGDGKNDIDMFQLADEGYAVQNAVDELKSIATGIIENNDSDGVAKWLEQNYKR